MSFIVVIPARYASTRLPAKLLLKINKKPLIQYTWQQAKRSRAKQVIIATDSQEIFDVCSDFGATVCLTDKNHQSGTNRICEVVEKYNFSSDDIVVNLQGDEPAMPSDYLNKVADNLQQNTQAMVATLASKISDNLDNPNVVKVVLDKNNNALYFSRSALPYPRESIPTFTWHKHLGVYAYRVSFLKKYQELSSSQIEKIESLEQLRILWHGYKISVEIVDNTKGTGVDTIDDFFMVRDILT